MTTEEYLVSIGLPSPALELARTFLMENLDDPKYILDVASELYLSNQMLADLYGNGATADDVVQFFAAYELHSSRLDSTDDAVIDPYADLKFMVEEEKMARDLYDALYESTGLMIFDRISDSEQQHFDAMVAQANRLEVDLSNLELEEAGLFSNTEIQNLYNQLLAQGLESTVSAINVGVAVEETDIVDLANAIEVESDITLIGVYQNLLDGSYSHLDSFTGL